MRMHTPALAMAALLVTAPLVAQSDAKATDVLEAARKAIGGKRLDDMKTLSVQSQVQRNVGQMQMATDLELLLELPDRYYRSETVSSGVAGGTTTGFNGEKPLSHQAGVSGSPGAMVFRMGPGGAIPDAKKLTPDEQEKADKAAVRSMRTDVSRLMLGWFAMAHPALAASYSYAGEAESPDGKADAIDIKNADGFAARLFVDQSTHLPLMLTYKGAQPRTIQSNGNTGSPADFQKRMEEAARQPPVMTDYTIFFEDWQDVDGIKFPFKLRRAMAGSTTEEWSIAKVKVNPKIDEKKFAVEG